MFNDSGFYNCRWRQCYRYKQLNKFRNEVSVSNTGDVLATTLKYGDQLDSALPKPKIAIYRLNPSR